MNKKSTVPLNFTSKIEKKAHFYCISLNTRDIAASQNATYILKTNQHSGLLFLSLNFDK